jgi:hypothetical protein
VAASLFSDVEFVYFVAVTLNHNVTLVMIV